MQKECNNGSMQRKVAAILAFFQTFNPDLNPTFYSRKSKKNPFFEQTKQFVLFCSSVSQALHFLFL